MKAMPWEGVMPSFRLFGNIYFTGTRYASTHIIRTSEGLIMLDSGYQETLHQVLHSMHRCGLDPYDIKYIIHSHGHVDHTGATRTLVEMTGAKTFIGAGDRAMAEEENHPLSWQQELGCFYAPFKADHLLRDGDKITLGDVTINCVETAGHSPGVISFFWDEEQNGKKVRAGTMGGAGLNTLHSAYIRKYGLESEDWRGAFRKSIERCRQEKVDLFIGNHAGQNQTPQRYERWAAGDKEAFVDPASWGNFLDSLETSLCDLIQKDPL